MHIAPSRITTDQKVGGSNPFERANRQGERGGKSRKEAGESGREGARGRGEQSGREGAGKSGQTEGPRAEERRADRGARGAGEAEGRADRTTEVLSNWPSQTGRPEKRGRTLAGSDVRLVRPVRLWVDTELTTVRATGYAHDDDSAPTAGLTNRRRVLRCRSMRR